MKTLALSRAWLTPIAETFGVSVGMTDKQALAQTSVEATHCAEHLLKLAPWHFQFLIFLVEMAASLWCVIHGLRGSARRNPVEEIQAFEKVPFISAPLLKLYRSLVALSWFELPEVAGCLGLSETREQRQQQFRLERNNVI